MPCFPERVFSLLSKVPKGKITTYKALAVAAKKPKASRAIGQIMHSNKNAPSVPCHRVVKSNGFVGGYGLGIKRKKMLLEKEGIGVKSGKIIGFEDKLYKF